MEHSVVVDGWAIGRCRSSLYETLTLSVPIAMLLSSSTNSVSSDIGRYDYDGGGASG